ncbi:hypothetical protein K491DRAFT_603454, partial [Lophiostoma macrostomum CBS 122681]
FALHSPLSNNFDSISRSNHAAGDTFQDALARNRTARDQHGLSIDIGWTRTIGIVSAKEEY